MRRIRTLVVLGAVAAALLIGATVAQADWGWWWNAQLDVEGTEVHTAWTVVGDPDGSNYRAQIKVWAPRGADVTVIDQGSNETVVTPAAGLGLACSAEGVEAKVEYLVQPLSRSAVGQDVAVQVVADGVVIGTGSGKVGERVSVGVLVPANSPGC